MTAPILQVLVESHRLPRRTTTGLESLQYAVVHREGSLLLQGKNGGHDQRSSPAEEMESLIFRLQPLVEEWTETDRAVLVLLLREYTVREIKSNLHVSGDRVCDVRRRIGEFLAD